MASDWSNSGIDLLLERGAGNGLRAGLERAIREAIRSGRLAAGTRLPSTRVLARDLAVARGTVADAYAQLIAEGYLAGRQGSGTRVAPRTEGAARPSRAAAHRCWTPSRQPAADFFPGHPDLSAFPRAAWMAATRRVLREAPDDALGYGDPRGRIELRQALTGYLGRARGVVTSPDLVVICSGYAQASSILSEALRSVGARTVAFEHPCLPEPPEVARRHGLRVEYVPVDSSGIKVWGLAATGADAVVVTPAHQCPLGVTLSAARRTSLVAWARDRGGLVIEDDYDGEFRYDRQPVGAVQGLAPEHVAYAGTASKTLAPGLRLAWLAVPPGLLDAVAEAKERADRQTAVLDQLVLAGLIGSGEFDRHVRRCRSRYRRRRDRLAAALAEHAPWVRLHGVAAGIGAFLELPPDRATTEREVLREAARRSVRLNGLGYFWHLPGDRPQGVVVGYATPADHAYEGALAELVEILKATA